MYSKAFFSSKPWKELRAVAIDLLGTTCLCCQKENLNGYQLHVDHVIPRSRNINLQLVLSNLQILCATCNGYENGKGTEITDYRNDQQRQKLATSTYVPLKFVYVRKRKPNNVKDLIAVRSRLISASGLSSKQKIKLVRKCIRKIGYQHTLNIAIETLGEAKATDLLSNHKTKETIRENREINRMLRVAKYLEANPSMVVDFP